MTVTFDDSLFGSTKVESKSEDFDDLFSEPPVKPKRPPSTAAKQKTPPTDDLFAAPSTTPKTKSNKDDASDAKPSRTESKKPKVEVNIFDSPPEDIFGAAAKGKKVDTDDIFASSTSDIFSSGGKKSKGLDDLFATDVPKASKGKRVKREAVKEEVGRGDGKREEAGKEDTDAPQTDVPKAKAKDVTSKETHKKEVSKEEMNGPQPEKVSENFGLISSLIPRPSITANTVEGLVKLLRRMMSGGRLEAWHFR